MMLIHDRFEDIAQKQPNKIAVVFEGKTLTYFQLNQYANTIANRICAAETTNPVVGICMERSGHLVAAMLGVLKAGMAYLPIDSSYPKERISQMLQDAKAELVLSTENTKQLMNDVMSDGCMQISLSENISAKNQVELQEKMHQDLACILYTSGSTGVPNGVMITHKSILNTLNWAISYYQLSNKDVLLQIPSCSFTSSLQDIFTTLLSGGMLVMIKEKNLQNMKYLKKLCDQYHVTHFDMVPSLYNEYIKVETKSSSLRFVLLAGEPLKINLVRTHYKTLPHVKLVNEYGMAETSSCFSYYCVMSDCEKIYIGKPINNMQYLIFEKDEDGIGELYISGPGVAKGYYRNSKYTDEKFISINDKRYLKTGDFVKEAIDGNLEYICRKDNQIKINGKRINLNDIDYLLQKNINVKNCFTTGVLYKEKQLIVAFIESDINDENYFFKILKTNLPEYALPNYIKILNKFFYLHNKKINLKFMKEIFLEELKKIELFCDDKYVPIIEMLERISKIAVENLDLNLCLKNQGLDSLSFIRLLSELEIKYEFEFDYNDMEWLGNASIVQLYQYILERKELT